MNIREIQNKYKSQIIEIAKFNKVEYIKVFGSTLTNEQNENSDIDFLVKFNENASLIDRSRLSISLSKLLGKKVDIVTESQLHWYIKKDVLSEAVPV